MLAYVFWHRPLGDVAPAEYEELLTAFHRALAANPPPGFHESAAFRVSSAPWIPTGGPAYEDWYLLRDAAALDPLNQAAVSGPRQRPHDVVAARAGWGAAGLYRLRRGAPAFGRLGRAHWLSKPAGETYEAFYRDINRRAGSGAWALWGRQMVLGPTPEFCLHGSASLPDGETGLVVQLESVYSLPSHDSK